MTDPQAPNPRPSETERVFRETILWRFEKPEHVELLTQAGDFLFTLAVDSGFWGSTHGKGVIAGQLTAGARDLEHLVGYLKEVAETAVHASVSPEELAMCRRASDCADRLARVLEELREATETPATAGRESGR